MNTALQFWSQWLSSQNKKAVWWGSKYLLIWKCWVNHKWSILQGWVIIKQIYVWDVWSYLKRWRCDLEKQNSSGVFRAVVQEVVCRQWKGGWTTESQLGSWSSTFPWQPVYLNYQLFRRDWSFISDPSLFVCIYCNTDTSYDPCKLSHRCWNVCCPLLNSSFLFIMMCSLSSPQMWSWCVDVFEGFIILCKIRKINHLIFCFENTCVLLLLLGYFNFTSQYILYLSYETLFAYALVKGCRNS